MQLMQGTKHNPTLKDYIKALRKVKSNALKGRYYREGYFGICFLWSQEMATKDFRTLHNYSLVARLSKGWSKHSGMDWYPVVPSYAKNWRGKQLALRLELIDFILAKLHNTTQEAFEEWLAEDSE